jgi:flavin-dependent dehydrogenase
VTFEPGRLEGGYGFGYSPARPISAPHLLLAGDAAGGNLLTGEGIGQALEFGKLAAAEIAAAYGKDDFSFRNYGSRLARSELGRNLREAGRIARTFYTEGPQTAVPSIAADRALRKSVADYMAGTESDACRRAILTRIVAGFLKHGRPRPATMLRILVSKLF